MPDITQTITVKVGTVCRNPFYVRWVNTLGGHDHWLFQINQIYNIDVEEMSRAGIYVEDVASAEGEAVVTRHKATPRVRCIASAITTDEAKAISGVRHSKHVKLYRPDTDDWVRVLPVSGSFQNYATDQLQQNIEIEFELPTIKTQSI